MPTSELQRLHVSRRTVAATLTVIISVVYVGFILLIAYAKPFLTQTLVPGLSIGILLGVLVIATAWVLIWIYVRWANRHYDAAITAYRNRT